MFMVPYLGVRPRVGPDLDAAADAAIIGRAVVGARCHLGVLATLRADGHDIEVGDDGWFDDFSTVHIAHSVFPARVGNGVTVARHGLVHACDLGDGVVVGEHALVMDHSRVGAGAVIAADSVVPPGKTLEGGWLYAGTPAKPVREISSAELASLHALLRGAASGTDAALAELVRSPRLVPPLHQRPGIGLPSRVARGSYIAPTASLAGNLALGRGASLWFGVEIHGGGDLLVGDGSNVQDNTRVELARGERAQLGQRVTVGHNVRMGACVIEDDAMIGMGSTVGAGTVVKAGGVIAAGAVTEAGTVVGIGEIWSGAPARLWKPVPEDNRRNFARGVEVYIEYAANYSKDL